MAETRIDPSTTDQETEVSEQTTDGAQLPEPDENGEGLDVEVVGTQDSSDSTDSTDAAEEPALGGLAADASPPETAVAGQPRRAELLEREGDIAADYLEELLDIADLDGDIDMDVEGDRAAVSIVGGDLGRLVGRNGEVLDALQELTRLAVLRETGERSRLMLDIGGHRAERRSALERLAQDSVDLVRASGEPLSLDPMTPFERKVVHDVVAAAGLASDSEGVEPKRYVVVRPA